MQSVIAELYNIKTNRHEMDFSENPDYAQAFDKLFYNKENLLETLNESEKTALHQILAAQTDIAEIAATENFSYGFKLGARLMTEILFNEC